MELYYEIFNYINIKNVTCLPNIYNNINFIITPKLTNCYCVIYAEIYMKVLSYINYFFRRKYQNKLIHVNIIEMLKNGF